MPWHRRQTAARRDLSLKAANRLLLERDVVVHAIALERAGIQGMREGQNVKFDTQNDPRSGKIAVSIIELA
jgi:hypothetical protein